MFDGQTVNMFSVHLITRIACKMKIYKDIRINCDTLLVKELYSTGTYIPHLEFHTNFGLLFVKKFQGGGGCLGVPHIFTHIHLYVCCIGKSVMEETH